MKPVAPTTTLTTKATKAAKGGLLLAAVNTKQSQALSSSLISSSTTTRQYQTQSQKSQPNLHSQLPQSSHLQQQQQQQNQQNRLQQKSQRLQPNNYKKSPINLTNHPSIETASLNEDLAELLLSRQKMSTGSLRKKVDVAGRRQEHSNRVAADTTMSAVGNSTELQIAQRSSAGEEQCPDGEGLPPVMDTSQLGAKQAMIPDVRDAYAISELKSGRGPAATLVLTTAQMDSICSSQYNRHVAMHSLNEVSADSSQEHRSSNLALGAFERDSIMPTRYDQSFKQQKQSLLLNKDPEQLDIVDDVPVPKPHQQQSPIVKMSNNRQLPLTKQQIKTETEAKARQFIEYRPAVAKIIILNQDGSLGAQGATPSQTELLKQYLQQTPNTMNRRLQETNSISRYSSNVALNDRQQTTISKASSSKEKYERASLNALQSIRDKTTFRSRVLRPAAHSQLCPERSQSQSQQQPYLDEFLSHLDFKQKVVAATKQDLMAQAGQNQIRSLPTQRSRSQLGCKLGGANDDLDRFRPTSGPEKIKEQHLKQSEHGQQPPVGRAHYRTTSRGTRQQSRRASTNSRRAPSPGSASASALKDTAQARYNRIKQGAQKIMPIASSQMKVVASAPSFEPSMSPGNHQQDQNVADHVELASQSKQKKASNRKVFIINSQLKKKAQQAQKEMINKRISRKQQLKQSETETKEASEPNAHYRLRLGRVVTNLMRDRIYHTNDAPMLVRPLDPLQKSQQALERQKQRLSAQVDGDEDGDASALIDVNAGSGEPMSGSEELKTIEQVHGMHTAGHDHQYSIQTSNMFNEGVMHEQPRAGQRKGKPSAGASIADPYDDSKLKKRASAPQDAALKSFKNPLRQADQNCAVISPKEQSRASIQNQKCDKPSTNRVATASQVTASFTGLIEAKYLDTVMSNDGGKFATSKTSRRSSGSILQSYRIAASKQNEEKLLQHGATPYFNTQESYIQMLLSEHQSAKCQNQTTSAGAAVARDAKTLALPMSQASKQHNVSKNGCGDFTELSSFQLQGVYRELSQVADENSQNIDQKEEEIADTSCRTKGFHNRVSTLENRDHVVAASQEGHMSSNNTHGRPPGQSVPTAAAALDEIKERQSAVIEKVVAITKPFTRDTRETMTNLKRYQDLVLQSKKEEDEQREHEQTEQKGPNGHKNPNAICSLKKTLIQASRNRQRNQKVSKTCLKAAGVSQKQLLKDAQQQLSEREGHSHLYKPICKGFTGATSGALSQHTRPVSSFSKASLKAQKNSVSVASMILVPQVLTTSEKQQLQPQQPQSKSKFVSPQQHLQQRSVVKLAKKSSIAMLQLQEKQIKQKQFQQHVDWGPIKVQKVADLRPATELGIVGATVTGQEQIFPQIYVTDYVRKVTEQRSKRQNLERARRESVKQRKEAEEQAAQKLLGGKPAKSMRNMNNYDDYSDERWRAHGLFTPLSSSKATTSKKSHFMVESLLESESIGCKREVQKQINSCSDQATAAARWGFFPGSVSHQMLKHFTGEGLVNERYELAEPLLSSVPQTSRGSLGQTKNLELSPKSFMNQQQQVTQQVSSLATTPNMLKSRFVWNADLLSQKHSNNGIKAVKQLSPRTQTKQSSVRLKHQEQKQPKVAKLQETREVLKASQSLNGKQRENKSTSEQQQQQKQRAITEQPPTGNGDKDTKLQIATEDEETLKGILGVALDRNTLLQQSQLDKMLQDEPSSVIRSNTMMKQEHEEKPLTSARSKKLMKLLESLQRSPPAQSASKKMIIVDDEEMNEYLQVRSLSPRNKEEQNNLSRVSSKKVVYSSHQKSRKVNSTPEQKMKEPQSNHITLNADLPNEDEAYEILNWNQKQQFEVDCEAGGDELGDMNAILNDD